jgi:transcription initiation factor IIF auxiliary subunit
MYIENKICMYHYKCKTYSSYFYSSCNCYFFPVVSVPPYHVAESGYAGFLLPIDIYFKNKEEPKKIRFQYDLFLKLDDTPSNIIAQKLGNDILNAFL